jgi:hypothetical protein
MIAITKTYKILYNDLSERGTRSESAKQIAGAAKCHASKERVLLVGTDQRITSGPAARTAAFRGPDTWLHPNDSQKSQILFPCTASSLSSRTLVYLGI